MKKIPVLKSLGMLFSNVFFWVILFYFCVPGTPGWAAKNWLPTLFSDSLSIDISVAGPMSTISIALSSLFGVLAGGYISDQWVLKMYVEEFILVRWVWGLSYLPCCLSDMVILFCIGHGSGVIRNRFWYV